MSDLLHLLLALGAVLAPLGLAWWLLRERPRLRGKASLRRPHDDGPSSQ